MSLMFAATAKKKLFRGFISAGYVHSLAVNKNRIAWSWGSNNYGQLGDNSVTSRQTPVSLVGTVKTFCKIKTGDYHSVAIDKYGRAWGWGNNSSGQLGNNSTTSRLTPISILGTIKTFCEISAGANHSLAIDKNGRAWGWGYNDNGELGVNSTTSYCTPVSVFGAIKTFCKINAGAYHSVAIDKNGRAWSWGANFYGELGDNSITIRLTPVSVLGAAKTFCKISNNLYFSLAIDKNGKVWSWGYNNFGQLGNNSVISRRTPTGILGAIKTFCKISAGGYHSVAIDKNGRAWSWGFNEDGQLGDNSTTSRLTPVSIAGTVKTFCAISAGGYHSLGIDKNGNMWAWGNNINGQLGNNNGGDTTILTPLSVAGAIKTFCQICAGSDFSLSIDKNGKIWSWGVNSFGKLGDNSSTNRETPVSLVGTVKTFCKISGGNSHSVAIDKNGRAWSWGYNIVGQLGDNSTTNQCTPVSVLGAIKTFCKINAGGLHSLVIDKNGRAWSWGYGIQGQLGDNSTSVRLTPVSVAGATKTFCDIDGGGGHSLAIDKNGRAWAWGDNSSGQLGNNSITSQLTPVSVLGAIKTFCKISAGNSHSVVIDKNGRAWSWGYNNNGQLGDNSITSRQTPVSVAGAIKTFCAIDGGSLHSVAIEKNGRAWSWGSNNYGQLGDNSVTSRLTPVSIAGAVKTFCAISSGAYHTIAIDKNGRAWGWGYNDSGRLGINRPPRILTPVRVCNI